MDNPVQPRKGFKRVSVQVTVKYIALVEVPEDVDLNSDSDFMDEITCEVQADRYQDETDVSHQLITGGEQRTEMRFDRDLDGDPERTF